MTGGPLLVFSPHLDDAVLSLGNVIAANPGSVVVTVLVNACARLLIWRVARGSGAGSKAL